MHYLGGKNRISKHITALINEYCKTTDDYYEPCLGAGWIMQDVVCKNRFGMDLSQSLISMWSALQSGWIPPSSISREEYSEAKNLTDLDPLKGFVGYGCSYSGKYFGGYAFSGERNYAMNAKNSLQRKIPKMKDVNFKCDDLYNLSCKNSVVYVDPPYQGTTSYKGTNALNYDDFWEHIRRLSDDNVVLVSSYNAPDDFGIELEINTKTDMRGGEQDQQLKRVERVFKRK